MIALTAVPVTWWHQASSATVYRGFDPNLISINALSDQSSNPGVAELSSGAIRMNTVDSSMPSVHLLTTASRSFSARMRVFVYTNPPGTTPLRLGIWSPWSRSGYFLLFGPAPDDAISTESVVGGTPAQTLVGGTVETSIVGHYLTGQPYDLQVTVNKDSGLMSYDLSGPALGSPIHTLAPEALARQINLTLTASASSVTGSSSAALEDYNLSVPSQTGGAVRIDDRRAMALLLLLGLIGAALLVVAGWELARHQRAYRFRIPAFHLARRELIVGGAVLAVIVLNAALFRLGNAPFDMADQETWSYIAARYGPVQVYVLAPFVSVARVWNGVPYADALFPYQPVMVYLFAGFGWLSRLFGSFQIDYLVKTVNLAFGLLDGYLIFSILMRLGVSVRWSLGVAALFVCNPMVWFSMSVWGANHVLSLFFVLLAILLAERDHPVGAWVALGIGSLTRPQMLVLGVLVGIVLLRRFSISRNVYALSWTVIVIFLLMVPFTIATSPSLPVDLLASTVQVQALGGNETALTTVSLDAYSFWPLVVFFQAGQSGLGRILYPSDSPLIGTVTYHEAGILLAAAVLVAAVVMLAVRPKASLMTGGYMPVLAFGIAGFLMFETGLAATHFILALPFILMCRPWLSASGYYSIVAGWTLTTLLAMYGILAADLARADYLRAPLFGQHEVFSSVTSLVAQLYTWDRAISVGVLINTAIFFALALGAVRSRATRQTLHPA